MERANRGEMLRPFFWFPTNHGRFWCFEPGRRFGMRNGYRLFARFEALFCYVMFYKNTGLIRNYQSFDSYICHSR